MSQNALMSDCGQIASQFRSVRLSDVAHSVAFFLKHALTAAKQAQSSAGNVSRLLSLELLDQ
jgi:hypothetical protein